MPEPICRTCGKHCEDWGELAQHINTSKDHRNKASKKWAKMYIHRHAIKKLREIGKKKEFEPRQSLTESQLEAKHEAKYTLSGETKFVPVRCPRCKTGRREALEIEFVNSPDAIKVDNCYPKICEGCR